MTTERELEICLAFLVSGHPQGYRSDSATQAALNKRAALKDSTPSKLVAERMNFIHEGLVIHELLVKKEDGYYRLAWVCDSASVLEINGRPNNLAYVEFGLKHSIRENRYIVSWGADSRRLPLTTSDLSMVLDVMRKKCWVALEEYWTRPVIVSQ